jgi:hypothetical protein
LESLEKAKQTGRYHTSEDVLNMLEGKLAAAKAARSTTKE